ncbi:MAG: response regulator, partial [Magnetococcales bacterium]|nr:response regulator [Magnetococcales bacterium]
ETMKTLIVDDILENRKLLQDILKPYGSCDMAADGFEALAFVEAALDEEEPYNLILLDIMMPKLDGQAALQRIRALEQQHGCVGTKEAVIFMVTANDSPREAASAFFKGYCSDYLTKPILRQTLISKLQEYRLIGS